MDAFAFCFNWSKKMMDEMNKYGSCFRLAHAEDFRQQEYQYVQL